MGINVRVESERGDAEAELLDPHNLTAKTVSGCETSSKCVRFIDPYGDTTFNQLQLPVLIDEVERALASVSDPKAMSHGQAILKLARQASSEAHTYLKFIGD